jgi:hypothetical protein
MEQNQNQNQNQEPNNQSPNPFNDNELGKFFESKSTPASAPPAEHSTPPAEPSAPVAIEFTDEHFNEYLSKKTEGKFSKLEDIPIAELPDESKEIYEILKAGKVDELYEYMSKSRADYSSLSTADLLAIKLKQDNPKMSDEDIKDILVHDYQVGYELTEEDKDNMSPRELAEWERNKKNADIRARRDAENMRDALEASKKELILPKIETIKPVVGEDPNAITEEQIAQAQEAWELEVDTKLPSTKEFSFEISVGDEGEKIATAFKLEGAQEEAVKQSLKSVYEPGDEKLPFEQLVEKHTFKLFGKQILAAAVKDAVAKAKETFVEKELKRVDLRNPSGKNQQNGLADQNWQQYAMQQ